MKKEIKKFHWNPLLVLESETHQLRIRKGDSVTVLTEPSDATALSQMRELGWFESSEFSVSDMTSLPEEIKFILAKLIEVSALRELGQHDSVAPLVHEMCARSNYQVSESEATMRLLSTNVFLTGDSDHLLTRISEDLKNVGIEVKNLKVSADESLTRATDTNSENDAENVVIAAYRDLFSKKALEHNEAITNSLLPGRTLFLGGFDGSRAVVGPWVVPGKSACLNCWTTRRRANLVDVPYAVRPGSVDGIKVASPHYQTRAQRPSVDQVIAAFVTDMVAEYIVLGKYSASSRPGSYRVVESSRNGIVFETHHILRLPRCEVCGKSRSTGYPQVWHHG